MTTPLPPKRKAAREALPAIYVVIGDVGIVLYQSVVRSNALGFARLNGYEVTKYLPAPRAGKAKGGKRG